MNTHKKWTFSAAFSK